MPWPSATTAPTDRSRISPARSSMVLLVLRRVVVVPRPVPEPMLRGVPCLATDFFAASLRSSPSSVVLPLRLCPPARRSRHRVTTSAAQAQQLEQQLETNGAQVAALGEQLNAAQLQVDDAQARAENAKVRIVETKTEITRLEDLIDLRAVAIYQSGGLATSFDIFDTDNASETNVRLKYGEIASRRDNQLVNDLAAAKKDLQFEQSQAERARRSAATERDRLTQAKAEADAAAAEQQRLLDQVKGELAELVRQEQERRAASAAPASGRSTWDGPAPEPERGRGGGGRVRASAAGQAL